MIYQANVKVDFLVLHGPRDFWPGWTLGSVGDVSTFALTAFAIVYGVWLLIFQRIYKASALRARRWPVGAGVASSFMASGKLGKRS
tara:strand:- start:181 stop:438 length:258 start_codon:yes stop_codon:yes gene_type:complete